MKQHLPLILLTTALFATTLILLGAPAILPVFASNSSSFSVSLTVDNVGPQVISVDNISDSPTEASTKTVSFYFNASDPNGGSDILTGGQLFIYRAGVMRNATSCSNVSVTGNEVRYICNITINWYDSPGNWSINASVKDAGGVWSYDYVNGTFTMGTTYGIALTPSSLSFSGNPGDTGIGASDDPLVVNNTGNGNFTEFVIAAYDLQGASSWIYAENFSANVTDASTGTALQNATGVTIPNSSLVLNNTRNVYVYVNIPTGANGTYSSMDDWVLTAQ